VVEWLKGLGVRMFHQLGRMGIYHILGVVVIGVCKSVFRSHLYVCVCVDVRVAEEESGRVPGVYHYYSQKMQYGKNKGFNENVKKSAER
jgi:hypothetical protein